MAARDLRLPHIDQCRLTHGIARLRELQELFVTFEGLLGEISLRACLQHRQVLLLDAGDEHVLRAGDVGISGALLCFREPRLRQRRPRELPGESQIVE